MATRGGIKGRSVEAQVFEVIGFQGESEARVVRMRFTDERGLVFNRGHEFCVTRVVPVDVDICITVWRDEWPGDQWPPAPGDSVPVSFGYGLLVRKAAPDAVRGRMGSGSTGDGPGAGPDAPGAG